ncbi:MAG: acyltransferase [Bacteroidales bacterium]|nr:acyltransferase [Bacteroidales bacterium]
MRYFEKIDGLRFVAIFFVLIEHFAPLIGHKISAGYYGVDLFFVISGFLITNILLVSKGNVFTSYKNFVGRRTLRIFPIYYITIFAFILVGYEPARDYLLYLATYTFNYAWLYFDIPDTALNHFWSLAVEEQFYLFWPFLVLPFRKKTKALFYVIIIITALCFVQLTFRVIESVNMYNYVGIFPRAGSLTMGALGGLLFNKKLLSDSFFSSKLIELFVISLLVVSLLVYYPGKEFVLALTSLYLVLKATHSNFSFPYLNRLLSSPKAIFIGKISYGIYIFHHPISYFLTTLYILPWWGTVNFELLGKYSFIENYLWLFLFPFFVILSIIMAYFSNKYIEKPILSFKDVLFAHKKEV